MQAIERSDHGANIKPRAAAWRRKQSAIDGASGINLFHVRTCLITRLPPAIRLCGNEYNAVVKTLDTVLPMIDLQEILHPPVSVLGALCAAVAWRCYMARARTEEKSTDDVDFSALVLRCVRHFHAAASSGAAKCRQGLVLSGSVCVYVYVAL